MFNVKNTIEKLMNIDPYKIEKSVAADMVFKLKVFLSENYAALTNIQDLINTEEVQKDPELVEHMQEVYNSHQDSLNQFVLNIKEHTSFFDENPNQADDEILMQFKVDVFKLFVNIQTFINENIFFRVRGYFPFSSVLINIPKPTPEALDEFNHLYQKAMKEVVLPNQDLGDTLKRQTQLISEVLQIETNPNSPRSLIKMIKGNELTIDQMTQALSNYFNMLSSFVSGMPNEEIAKFTQAMGLDTQLVDPETSLGYTTTDPIA